MTPKRGRQPEYCHRPPKKGADSPNAVADPQEGQTARILSWTPKRGRQSEYCHRPPRGADSLNNVIEPQEGQTAIEPPI